MVGAPIALKLYGLNLTVFQVPLSKVNGDDRHPISDHLLSQHIHRQVRFFFNKFFRELGPLAEFVAYHLLHLNKFPLF